MNKTFDKLFVTMFGIGKAKFIPGSLGSLVTVLILYFCFHIFKINHFFILLILILIFIYSFLAISNYTKNIENKDPGEIVIDEFIGQSIPIYLYEISHNMLYEISRNIEKKDTGDFMENDLESICQDFGGENIAACISEPITRSHEVIILYAIFFFLFRYFDIIKPFPVSYFDKKHKNSFGVIMDDVCAGIYVVLSVICFMTLKNYFV